MRVKFIVFAGTFDIGVKLIAGAASPPPLLSLFNFVTVFCQSSVTRGEKEKNGNWRTDQVPPSLQLHLITLSLCIALDEKLRLTLNAHNSWV